ncbi:diguanylate cyclase [Paraglaciecola aquimarina]|uniref:diguanylate cyclase n=1 Tax=Paraglaciecola algarum TaxID=3050085 RepID=A0ABS9DAC4_9ALTE|nr:GGDEF domain-containing protein [Paraglaciecola sp. G1-23]MCF2948744.1 diguanylate cyclase [Paraglaciecola sp. G1-23]
MKKPNNVRIPLIRFFGIALSIILSLFLLVTWLTFSRLVNFETVLKNFSEQALPTIVLSGELYNEASQLLQFTDLLANANSDAAKRLAEQELNTYIRKIKSLSSKKLDDSFLDKQLEIINLELLEFSDLIWQRADINKKLAAKRQNMYTLFTHAFDLIQQSPRKPSYSDSEESWISQLSRLMLITDQAINAKRMQEVRGLFARVKQQVMSIQITDTKHANTIEQQNIIRTIKHTIFASDGLEHLVISHLKLTGRVKGRENFMRHLIEDFSRLLEITTNETKTNIFKQVALSVEDTENQINTIGGIILMAIILMFIILFFIQNRILKRLQNVNLMVQNKIKGQEGRNVITGNDEITDLADAFNKFADTIEIQKEKLELMSLTDGLTKIANRRALDIRLQHDIELSVRQKFSVAVLLIDIDFFKLYNDNYGHSAGDECLKSIAQIISNALQRESDFVARYGGEEFVCVLPNTDLPGALERVQHIFESIQSQNLAHEYSSIDKRVTISMGVAISTPQQVLMPEAILKQADVALYMAKHAGKNTYKVYSSNM